jgi:ketosteroid isomerase-like protein
MKPSPEIEKLLRESLESFERGDFSVAEKMTSKQPGVVSIGTAADEYERGYDRIVRQFRTEAQATPRIHFRIGEIHAFEDGDVGWADGTGSFESDGKTVETRSTAVYLRESGEWKGVQSHVSIGVPNELMFDPLFPRQTART